MPQRILIVDDEAINRELLEAILTGFGYEQETAADGFEALAKLKLDIDLVLCDLMMPGMDGFEVVQKIREGSDNADVPICMVTSLSGKEQRLRAVEAGANDFIAKPVDRFEVEVRVRALLKIKEAQDALKSYQSGLEETVERRTTALREALQEMSAAHRETYEAHVETIERLAVAAEYKDEDTANHISRMSHYAHIVALELKLPPKDCELILHSSPMHDVGKLGIADAILLKPGKLDAAEWDVMKTHTTIGGRILEGSSSDLLQTGEVIAMTHHERWDGSGYPNGLTGEDIPIMGRITSIADVFDALTSKRPYKEPFSVEKSVDIIKEGQGSHFDPAVVDAFMNQLDAILLKKKEHSD
ncbi:HD domain-containing phosphohydrolase [Candidatus Bipolaricaulota bacterium]